MRILLGGWGEDTKCEGGSGELGNRLGSGGFARGVAVKVRQKE